MCQGDDDSRARKGGLGKLLSVYRAAFVCASAIGMALGPLLSLLLVRVPTTRLLGLTINPITSAGWIMLGIWAVFIAAWIALFKEPLAQCARPLSAR